MALRNHAPAQMLALWALNCTKETFTKLFHPTNGSCESGSHFLAHGEPEVHELPRLVEPGTVAVDVGANIGCYAFAYCRAVGPEGHVLCVEPLEDLARLLRAAADRLGLPMTVVNCAYPSSPAPRTFKSPGSSGKGGTPSPASSTPAMAARRIGWSCAGQRHSPDPAGPGAVRRDPRQ